MWSTFSYGHHLYILFGEVSVKAFGLLFNQVAHFLIVEIIVEFLRLYILDSSSLSAMSLQKFSPVCALTLILLTLSFAGNQFLILIKCILIIYFVL